MRKQRRPEAWGRWCGRVARESAVPAREVGPRRCWRRRPGLRPPGTGSLQWGPTPVSQGCSRGGGRDQAPEMVLGEDSGDNQKCLDPGYFRTLNSISWCVRRRL